ncbi:MAG: DUF6498-containing protein [Chitinophagaceae bacterium]
MLKKISTDWSLWVLVIFNLYLLDYYEKHPGEIGTLIFLYWAQSVLIGVVNFFDILTLPHIEPGSMTMNDKPVADTAQSKGCVAMFFLVHYGIFHLVYLVFILVQMHGQINGHFVLIGVAILAVQLVGDFIRRRMQQQDKAVNVGTIFFMPYARIVPMHFMILLPNFIHINNFTIFIILKIFMDLLMHFFTSDHYKRGGGAASLSSKL